MSTHVGKMFVNCTPHAIVLAGPTGDVTIPPSGNVARVTMTPTTIGEAGGFPIVANVAGPVTGLPEAVPGVFVIVSGMVRGALVGRPDVLAPDTGPTARRNAAGQVEAVRGFVGPAGTAGPVLPLREARTRLAAASADFLAKCQETFVSERPIPGAAGLTGLWRVDMSRECKAFATLDAIRRDADGAVFDALGQSFGLRHFRGASGRLDVPIGSGCPDLTRERELVGQLDVIELPVPEWAWADTYLESAQVRGVVVLKDDFDAVVRGFVRGFVGVA